MMRRIAVLVIGLLGSAELAAGQSAVPALERLVSRLNADVVTNPYAFNSTFGANLVEDDGGGYSVHGVASDVTLEGIPFQEIELRSPRPGFPVSAGPILVFDLDHKGTSFFPKAEVRRAYPDLEWFGPPSPHEMDPDDTLERPHGAARLLFGFATTGAECLRTIVYRFDDPL